MMFHVSCVVNVVRACVVVWVCGMYDCVCDVWLCVLCMVVCDVWLCMIYDHV